MKLIISMRKILEKPRLLVKGTTYCTYLLEMSITITTANCITIIMIVLFCLFCFVVVCFGVGGGGWGGGCLT